MSMSSGKVWEIVTSTCARAAGNVNPDTVITDGYGTARVGGSVLSAIVIAPVEQNWLHWLSCRHPGPSMQLSTVHGFPSSHGLDAWTQAPVAGVQLSTVQSRPSLQLTG